MITNFLTTSTKFLLSSLLFIIFLAGCVVKNYPELKPLEPSLTYTLGPKTVDSLSPTFRWGPFNEPGVTYDFIIHKAGRQAGRHLWHKGPRVYYREGLENAEHVIEIKLVPDTLYLWSVRVRKKDEVLPWSSTSFVAGAVVGYYGTMSSGENWLFPFKTPEI